jgi:hypothetical protein
MIKVIHLKAPLKKEKADISLHKWGENHLEEFSIILQARRRVSRRKYSQGSLMGLFI